MGQFDWNYAHVKLYHTEIEVHGYKSTCMSDTRFCDPENGDTEPESVCRITPWVNYLSYAATM